MRSVYSASNGLSALQKRMDVLSNNIANVNTTGYKSSRVDFQDMLYQNIYRPGTWVEGNNLQMGHGATVGATVRYMTQGIISYTGYSTDLAIEGDGFFAVRGADGGVYYTRDGSFDLDGQGFLVTSRGEYVLDRNGRAIQPGSGNFGVDKNGNVIVGTQTIATLGIYSCVNPSGMVAAGDNKFLPSENSGAMGLAQQGSFTVSQGALEGSNVDLAQEFTYMIRTQRAMTMVSRALQTADEMDGKAAQLR